MAKSKVKTYPIYGETKVVGKKAIEKRYVTKGDYLDVANKEIDYKAAYEELKSMYRDYMNTSVTSFEYDKALKKCEELISANKTLAEQLASEKKSVELLQQQIQNKDVYITRLYAVIAELNIQILKK